MYDWLHRLCNTITTHVTEANASYHYKRELAQAVEDLYKLRWENPDEDSDDS